MIHHETFKFPLKEYFRLYTNPSTLHSGPCYDSDSKTFRLDLGRSAGQ